MKRRLPFLKARTVLHLRAREARYYFADWSFRNARNRKHNILIFGQGRSGSTLLEQLLISTGYFKGHHEVLNTVTRQVFFPTNYVRGIGRAGKNENAIVHVKPEHLKQSRKRPVDIRSFLESLIEDGWTIVHIQRQNVMRQLLSKDIAKSRGEFHKTDDQRENIKLIITENDFFERYERHIQRQADENDMLKGLPVLNVVYEKHLEFSSYHQSTIDRLIEHIGLDRRPVFVSLKKIATDSPSDILMNYDELRAACQAKSLEWTL
jgi:LPS sulfotransferase NodH